VNEKTAVGVQVGARWLGLVEHGAHAQLFAIEGGRPNLLSLVGQEHDFTATVADFEASNTTREGEGGDLECGSVYKEMGHGLEHGWGEMNH
jgi:hypothetical protein